MTDLLGDRLIWLAMTAGITLGTVQALRFRRGTNRRSLYLYRNVAHPATYRNLPLTAHMSGLAAAFLPLVKLPAVLELQVALPSWAEGLVIMIGGLALGLGSVSIIIAARSPSWIIPRWLAEENARLGIEAPRSGGFDRFVAIAMLGSLTAGIVVAAIGVWIAVR